MSITDNKYCLILSNSCYLKFRNIIIFFDRLKNILPINLKIESHAAYIKF